MSVSHQTSASDMEMPDDERRGETSHESPGKRAWRRLRANKLAIAGSTFIVFTIFAAIFGPMFCPWEIDQFDQEYIDLHLAEQDERDELQRELKSDIRRELRFEGLKGADMRRELQTRLNAKVVEAFGGIQYPLPAPPSRRHPFGTDHFARDVLVRVLHGARISLAVGLLASLIALVIGVLYGGVAGYVGGWTGKIMMRGVDILYGIPFLLFVIIFIIMFEGDVTGGTTNIFGKYSRMYIIFLALGITYWLPMSRIVRARVLQLKTSEFALAARALGAGHARVLLLHLLPNTIGPIVVTLTLSIPEAIFAEAFLAYIGLGISAPVASWGTLASEGTEYIRQAPHLLLWPAIAISLTMLAFNFLGDGLRDAFDPRQRDK